MNADNANIAPSTTAEFKPQYRSFLVGIDGNLHHMLIDPATLMMRAARDPVELKRHPYKDIFDPWKKVLPVYLLSFFFRGNPMWAWRLRDITEYPKGTRISSTGIRLEVVGAAIFVIGWFWVLAQIFQRKW